MVYFYRISWEWYEEYEPYELMHEKKFSEEEFRKMVYEAIRHAFKRLLEEVADSWVGFCEWERIAHHAIDYLREKYGFKPVEYTAEVSFFGLYIIQEKPYLREELKEFAEVVGEDLLRRILEHNKRVGEEMRSSRETNR